MNEEYLFDSDLEFQKFVGEMQLLVNLTSAKPFTESQFKVWYAFFGSFPVHVIHRAVIEIYATQSRFPAIGELYYYAHSIFPTASSVEDDLAQIARRLGIEITEDAAAQIASRLGIEIHER